MVGSTAFKSSFDDWDDFDLQIYTRFRPELDNRYEILLDRGKHYLVSAYYMSTDPSSFPEPSALDQADVRVLVGSEESLQHIRVDRPRRVEPLPREIRRFDSHHEVFFNILVDIFFILNRYEARGRPFATKPRVARDGLRTVCRHFYRFYGVDRQVSTHSQWRRIIRDLALVLKEKRYSETCMNKQFARAAMDLMTTSEMPTATRRKTSRPRSRR